MAFSTGLVFAQSLKIIDLAELTGAGTTSGSHFHNGSKRDVKVTHATTGLLDHRIDFTPFDTLIQPRCLKGYSTDDAIKAVNKKIS